MQYIMLHIVPGNIAPAAKQLMQHNMPVSQLYFDASSNDHNHGGETLE